MRIIYLIVLQLFVTTLTYSQVTIGSGIIPNKGALLDLKENDVTNGANSTKGLIFPRVSLNQKNTLIDISDVAYTETAEQIAHTGLVVYNTNSSFDNGKGLYSWDGAKWISFKPDTIETIVDKIVYTERSYFMGMSNSKASILDLKLLGFPSGWTIFSYNNAFINTGNVYDIDTGVFKVQNAGRYDIFARFQSAGLTVLEAMGLGILVKRATGTNQTFEVLAQHTYISLLATGEWREVSLSNIELNIGDEIAFGIAKANLLSLTVASSNGSYAVIRQK